MIKRIKGTPRGIRLAVYGIVILVLIPMIWAMLGFPPLTKGMKFRRLMAEYGYPDESPELIVEPQTGDYLGIRADDNYAYVADLGDRSQFDRSSYGYYAAWYVPAADGVLYVPLEWWTKREEIQGTGAEAWLIERKEYDWYGYAVKAAGADASLTAICKSNNPDEPEQRYPLILQNVKNGWFVFSKVYNAVPDYLELVTRDKAGNVLEQVSWKLP